MEKQLISNLSIAMNYIENAYEQLNYYVKNEDSMKQSERDKFYCYGRDKLRTNLIRLVNIKKSINTIVGNKKMNTM